MPENPTSTPTDLNTTSGSSSFWLAGATAVDVVVLGGGIAASRSRFDGSELGASVAVLEAHTVGSKVTGCTTPKVTALQATMLGTIVSHHDSETAAVHAAASSTAVEDIAQFTKDLNINCDLDRRPAVTCAATPEELKSVADEYDAAIAAGLPVTWSDDGAGMPYEVSGAVWLDEQIGVQSVNYVRGLAGGDEIIRASQRPPPTTTSPRSAIG